MTLSDTVGDIVSSHLQLDALGNPTFSQAGAAKVIAAVRSAIAPTDLIEKALATYGLPASDPDPFEAAFLEGQRDGAERVDLTVRTVTSPPPKRYVWPERIVGPGMEKMTEKQLQSQIILTASYCGYTRAMHIPYSVDMPEGWPDLTLVRIDRRAPDICFFEIKGPRGKVSDSQLAWLADLRATGHHAYLVQPKDWDTIVDILRNIHEKPKAGTGAIDPDLSPLLTMDQVTGRR